MNWSTFAPRLRGHPHVLEQKKIRLRLNLESAQSAGLNVSSKLIQVAELDKSSLLWPYLSRISGFEKTEQLACSAQAPFAR
jgi:hypothetical protein